MKQYTFIIDRRDYGPIDTLIDKIKTALEREDLDFNKRYVISVILDEELTEITERS